MILGALLDAGARRETLDGAVAALGLSEAARVRVERRLKGDVDAAYVDIEVLQPGPWRTVAEIDEVIAAAPLDEGVRERSRLAFRLLGAAEARAHGVPADKVRLHEAGAVDAIIDVVGSFVLADELGAEAFYSSAMPLCHGTVESDHGTLPLPAPAAANILDAVGAPTFYRDGDAELVTPTGAAIVGACASFEPAQLGAIAHEGYGAGTADLEWPNVLRIAVGDLVDGGAAHAAGDTPPAPAGATGVLQQQGSVQLDADEAEATGSHRSTVAVIETNIDDMAPNLLADVPRAMLAAGALEAFLTPVVMKKGRPGHLLTVVCAPAMVEALADQVLRQTSTLGVRVREERRIVAARRVVAFDSSLGAVGVKLKLLDGVVVDAVPEYEEVRAAADAAGVPLADAHWRISEEARRHFLAGSRE
jgi:uncharacterized protein (TIGR00299 family) protein